MQEHDSSNNIKHDILSMLVPLQARCIWSGQRVPKVAPLHEQLREATVRRVSVKSSALQM